MIIQGDCREVLATMDENSIDTCITDPPYHLTSITKRFGKEGSAPAKVGKTGAYARHSTGFMGKKWDGGGVAFEPETWEAVYRVLKPGATLLAFGGTRTYHRLAVAIEDAGFEIRDCIFWIYGSGFPKSHNIGKGIDKMQGNEREVIDSYKREGRSAGIMGNKVKITREVTQGQSGWDGWGTALKPACEPIVVAMKPKDGTFAENALKWGVAGLNVDGGRIGTEGGETHKGGFQKEYVGDVVDYENAGVETDLTPKGRWPANVILDEASAEVMDEQSGVRISGKVKDGYLRGDKKTTATYGEIVPGSQMTGYGDKGGASRFFYVAKASRKERNAGDIENRHPTVKPLKLMRYLCRLTATPDGGKVLDPFMGSGTTGMASIMEGRDFIGIDLNEEYVEIAEKRIEWAKQQTEQMPLFRSQRP